MGLHLSTEPPKGIATFQHDYLTGKKKSVIKFTRVSVGE